MYLVYTLNNQGVFHCSHFLLIFKLTLKQYISRKKWQIFCWPPNKTELLIHLRQYSEKHMALCGGRPGAGPPRNLWKLHTIPNLSNLSSTSTSSHPPLSPISRHFLLRSHRLLPLRDTVAPNKKSLKSPGPHVEVISMSDKVTYHVYTPMNISIQCISLFPPTPKITTAGLQYSWETCRK